MAANAKSPHLHRNKALWCRDALCASAALSVIADGRSPSLHLPLGLRSECAWLQGRHARQIEVRYVISKQKAARRFFAGRRMAAEAPERSVRRRQAPDGSRMADGSGARGRKANAGRPAHRPGGRRETRGRRLRRARSRGMPPPSAARHWTMCKIRGNRGRSAVPVRGGRGVRPAATQADWCLPSRVAGVQRAASGGC